MKMMGTALEAGIIAVFKHHTYCFDGQARLQAEGGSIGQDLTRVVARCWMLLWDRKLKERLIRAARDIE